MKSPFYICLFFSLFLFCAPQILYSSDIFSVQAGAFSSKRSAHNLVESLKPYGVKCSIHEIENLFKVSCGEFHQESDAYVLKRKISSLGHKGVFVITLAPEPSKTAKAERTAKYSHHREVVHYPKEKTTKQDDRKGMLIAKETVKKPSERADNKDTTIVQAKNTQQPNKEKPLISQQKTMRMDVTAIRETGSEPEAAEQERISGDIFEKRFGYLHPFVSITGLYTDNVFNTKDDKKYDYIAIFSPGIWIALPRIKQQLSETETSTISPGGFTAMTPGAFTHSRFKPDFFRRFQTYLYYRADIEQFSQYASENMINHIAEGLFNYNFRGGLSIEFLNQFARSHDIRGTGISRELDKFHSNLFNMMVTYDVSEHFKLRADYSNFLVNYEAPRNDFRDRLDNALSGYVFYKFLPKTAAFVEYRFINVDYDDPLISNSKEHNVFGGFQWDITAKSRGSIKGGYGIKDLVDNEIEHKDIILEAQVDYNLTPKTSLTLIASRRTNETNIPTTDFILSNSIEVEYRQRFTSRITGAMSFSYINDNYKGDLTFGGVTNQREDDYFGAGIALQYALRDWLTLDTAYQFYRRESSFSDFDYINNTIFFRITGSL
jgi:hypothetical protein